MQEVSPQRPKTYTPPDNAGRSNNNSNNRPDTSENQEPVKVSPEIDTRLEATQIANPEKNKHLATENKLAAAIEQDIAENPEPFKANNEQETFNSILPESFVKGFNQHKDKITLGTLALSCVGAGLHLAAAGAPFSSAPDKVKGFFDKTATFYSRFISSLPPAINSIPHLVKGDYLAFAATASPFFFLPMYKDVANMPMATSFLNVYKNGSEQIKETLGDSASKFEPGKPIQQFKNFIKDYVKVFQTALKELSQGKANSTSDLKSNIFKLLFVPGYAFTHVYGALFCRGEQVTDPVSKFARAFRGALGSLTDVDLITSTDAKKRTVGAGFVTSSTLSMFNPFIEEAKKHNATGQFCKALDEVFTTYWTAPDLSNILKKITGKQVDTENQGASNIVPFKRQQATHPEVAAALRQDSNSAIENTSDQDMLADLAKNRFKAEHISQATHK